ncbi:MAG: S9 family peptidase, partial [Candidatus Mcinerneyibacterium aminivorans]
KIGSPGLYDHVSVSPNGKYILLEEVKRPYSYRVPNYYFSKDYILWNIKGNIVEKIYHRSLTEEMPIGGTFKGARMFHWRPDKEASLIFIKALDEGDPEIDVSYRDAVLSTSYPFEEKRILFKSKHRIYRIDWGENESCIYYGRDKNYTQLYGYYRSPDQNKKIEIINRSMRNSYADMGTVLKKTNKYNKKVFMQKQNNIYFVNNEGDSPEGKYPYLSKFNLKTKENKIIYKSQSDSFETIEAVLNEELSKILINHQSKTEPENYYLVNLKNNSRKKITNYKNPYPKITNSKQEIIRYNRKDGVSLTGKLYLPPGYENKKRLPLIVWAYPLEYKSKKVAGQLKSSPNKFMKFWGASIKYLLLEGYAVVDASVPIVGDPETVNNTFVEQTVDSVKAVIDYLDKREIVDPKRVCIA